VSLAATEIASLLENCQLPVSEALAGQLALYLDLLLKWNARTNLTAIRTPEEMVRRHFADSLFCAARIAASAHTLLDFGSGGGFPGIPVALARPELAVTLAESQGKKASFLREAVRSLGIGSEVWPQRVEAMEPGRVFDAVTLRAVDGMAEACRAAAARVATGGQMLIFSTEKLAGEQQGALPEICWAEPVRLAHAEQGLLLLGTR
jgi:16S rRNA (guanine527-N7)-methyltransferase